MPTDKHPFRPKKLPSRSVRDAGQRFTAGEEAAYEEWSSFRKHKRLIDDAIAAHLISELGITPSLKASLGVLREQAEGRFVRFKNLAFERPHTFDLHPGWNVLVPPYDFNVIVKRGSQKPFVQASAVTGEFGVVATAMADPSSYSTNDTFGAGGVGLVLVPSDPSRTLDIRPYFQWSYSFSCESHGSPTAHSHGAVSVAISGHRDGERAEFPGRDMWLWNAGSDLWDDASGADSDVFRVSDSEVFVTGFDHYTLLYSCRAGGDSAKVRIGWWSAAFMHLHCRVPFIAIREF